MINAIAGGEVRGFRRAQLIHVHDEHCIIIVLSREVDMQSSHKDMDGFVCPPLLRESFILSVGRGRRYAL